VTTDTAAAEEGLLLPDTEFVGFQDWRLARFIAHVPCT